MMSADTVGILNVSGRSIAIVVIGPSPGSTPTSVPNSAPARQNSTFVGESATLNPLARPCSASNR
jgi:hypothetical protein